MTTAMAIPAVDDEIEPIYTLSELSALGYGHPQTIRQRIRAGEVPAERVDNRGTFVVRQRDLHMVRKPVRRPLAAENLDALAARLVEGWHRLSPERKAELARLLGAFATS